MPIRALSLLNRLCSDLAVSASARDASTDWPIKEWNSCREAGILRAFFAKEFQGEGWSERELIQLYIRIAEAHLCLAFIMTQWNAASRRIHHWGSDEVKGHWLPQLTDGRAFTTVGLSHLTTSRQHVTQGALRAEFSGDCVLLDGCAPWVTGAEFADVVVLGARLAGEQALVLVPKDTPGVTCEAPPRLVALSASRTCAMRFDQVTLPRESVLAGPAVEVVAAGGSGTGGLQTSALALGHAQAAIASLEQSALDRAHLGPIAQELASEKKLLEESLLKHADQIDAPESGAPKPDLSTEHIRSAANSLALRASHAALVAAKGAGFVSGHAAERRCRESLFFLVWSCPQGVQQANLCEFGRFA